AAARAAAAREPRRDSVGKAGANQIGIDNFAFDPKVATVAPGTTVTWVNRDDVAHRIKSADDKFAPSPLLDTKGVYSVRLPNRGEYSYFCSLHPTMTGKVVVA
ncbi:MAG: plastocyanin/azurin family copper-binding protein, partial [Gemmatimonadaceae bacterium]